MPAKTTKAPPSADNQKIQSLEALVETISRGKYMWEATFDAISNPVMIVSPDYVIQRANRAAAKASAIDVRKMAGSKCYEALAGRTAPCPGCPMPETIKTQQSHFNTLDPFPKSDKEYQANAYALEPSGAEEQVVLYYRDMTEEKKLHRQLLQNEKMAAIGMLAGGVAHEINNPLGGILAFAQLAMRDLPPDHPTQEDLKEIEEAALRCKRIVQDLLNFSRQNKDEMMGPVQLNDVLKKMAPLIQVQARTNQIEVAYELAPELPLIQGSFHKLQQVFLNLVTNGYQAMAKGGRLVLSTSLSAATNRVTAAVSDTGPGIAEENLKKIFDPYFTTKGQGEGTGLGLSITYSIVREHGGEIEVKSKAGSGTTFHLSFPVMEK